MDDKLKAALKRMHQGTKNHLYYAFPLQPHGQAQEDAARIVDAFLTEHPDDDGEPATADWLGHVFAEVAARMDLTGAPGEQQIPGRFGRLTLGTSGGTTCLWLNGELLWTERSASHYRMERGHFRRLLAAIEAE